MVGEVPDYQRIVFYGVVSSHEEYVYGTKSQAEEYAKKEAKAYGCPSYGVEAMDSMPDGEVVKRLDLLSAGPENIETRCKE